MPNPLIIFIGNLTTHKAFVPDNFLTYFELNRLDTNEYGCLMNPTMDHVKMITSFYLIGKILVGRILLQPSSLGIHI